MLRLFLTKKVVAFEEFLKKEYDERFDKSRLKLKSALLDKKESAEFKEITKQTEEASKKMNAGAKKDNEESEEEEKGLNLFKMMLQ